ncbi:branched-chain amino acid ABC transporter permease, partial [Rhodococcus sp. NPDC019627]|uniref:branched-chain amino acid ABC transporter permease n=1 Tax=unclassified Rhodococcus (in: high G+C Gram-positive bacteria) TaxID=192944 RepID=UPI0033F01630
CRAGLDQNSDTFQIIIREGTPSRDPQVLIIAQASFAAVGAYTAGALSRDTDFPWPVVLLCSMLLPALLAGVLARPILRLPPLALVLATLAFGQVIDEVSARATGLTGGLAGIAGIEPLPLVGFGVGAYAAIWAIVILLVAGYANLVTGSRGRAINAIRIDSVLAQSVGANVARERTVVFTIAAGVSGAAGWMYAHYVGFVAPQSLSFLLSAAVLLMVIVGGKRSVIGPVVGAIFYVLVQDVLPVPADMQNVVFGLLLAFVLIFFPNGLVSLPAMWWSRRDRVVTSRSMSTSERRA